MNTKLINTILAAASLITVVPLNLLVAQDHTLSRSTIASGGGTSHSANYRMRSTIGQWDASRSGGISYSLLGGFWGEADVGAAPRPWIFLTGTNAAVVAWPGPSTGWVLQVSTDLAAANWTAADGKVNLVGAENQVEISPATGIRFYRLYHP